MQPATYVEDKSGQEWFCTSHQRRATHVRERDGYHCCDPSLGGICIPCDCKPRSLNDAERMLSYNSSGGVDRALLQTKTPWIEPSGVTAPN